MHDGESLTRFIYARLAMDAKNNPSARKKFIIKISILGAGLICLAGILAFTQSLNFGITLFILGILVGGAGALLGSPDPTSPINPRNLRSRSLIYWRQPNQDLLDRSAYNVKHSVPSYAIENVLAFAGFAAIILSIPFILQLMFSK
jgi:hypothetical protein